MSHLREVSLMLAFNDDDEVAKNELNFGSEYSLDFHFFLYNALV
jgi:hypothetical protein